MFKTAIHCHSTYSDGEFTLAELRELFIDADYHLVFMTDHAEWFDQDKLQGYVKECEELSDERFRFIAGLEFECERRMHILGYGVSFLLESKVPQNVISRIEGAGGVSVIAHPGDSMFDWIESFEILPTGIEAWNSKYDGPLAPRPRTFQLLNRLQLRKPEMKAFYGQDLHWKKQYRGLFNFLDCDSMEQISVLRALRAGSYHGLNQETELPSNGQLPEKILENYRKISERYMCKQKVFKRIKKMSGAVGKNLPAPLKAHLRKIFS